MALFQSTLPRGERLNVPAVTFCSPPFQSTRPHGARLKREKNLRIVVMFQSTRPHGARPGDRIEALASHRFNPRARTGRDLRRGGSRCSTNGFNPRARTRRDRCYPADDTAEGIVSIHTPARGATFQRVLSSSSVKFQSTRPRGARHATGAAADCAGAVSIHTPARGATAGS